MTTGTQRRRPNGRTPKPTPPAERARGGAAAGRVPGGRAEAPDMGNGGAVPGWGDASRPRRRLTGRQWLKLVALTVILVLLGGAAGWGAAQLLPTKYAAHTDVLYSITREQATGFLREDRNITTQVVLLNSRTVLDPVAAEWSMSVHDLSEAIEARVIGGSEVIRITLTDPDPDRAQTMLGTLVARYLDVSNNDPRNELRNYIDEQLVDVLSRISEVRAEAEERQGELAALVEREQWLRTQLDELRFSDIVGPGATLLVPPYLEVDPVSPKPLLTTAAGALSALVVSVFVVALVARRMTRV
jgi:uncharacterized protein involved in exopolysaccharide biosynthesis